MLLDTGDSDVSKLCRNPPSRHACQPYQGSVIFVPGGHVRMSEYFHRDLPSSLPAQVPDPREGERVMRRRGQWTGPIVTAISPDQYRLAHYTLTLWAGLSAVQIYFPTLSTSHLQEYSHLF